MHQNCQLQRAENHLNSFPQVDVPDSQEQSALTLRELFDEEENPLLRYAFSLTGRRAVAEEIVQDVFLQLHQKWNDVHSPKAWLYRCVRNRAYNYNRKHKRENIACDKHEDMIQLAEVASETCPLQQESIQEIHLLLEDLDEEDRLLVKLKYFDNLKYRDISAQTGLSIGNVGYRLHHILKGLAQKLGRLGIDDVS